MKQMGPDRPTGDGRGLVHRLLRVRRPNSGYQALISPLKAQQTRINELVDPLLESSPSAFRAGEGVVSAGSGGAAPGEKNHLHTRQSTSVDQTNGSEGRPSHPQPIKTRGAEG